MSLEDKYFNNKLGHEVNKYRIMSIWKVEKDISSGVKGNSIGRAVILVIIYFATLQTDVNDVIIHLS